MRARLLAISLGITICFACAATRFAPASALRSHVLVPAPATAQRVGVPSTSSWRVPVVAEPARERPSPSSLPVRPALVKPDGIDLDVTYINRMPMYKSYCVAYPEPWNGTVGIPQQCPGTEDERRWPDPGEVVTFTAHIVNKGTIDSGAFAFAWFIDGSAVLSGTHAGLAPGEEGTATYLWPWAHAMAGECVLDDHTVRFVVDPPEVIAETYECNNALEDRTNALSLRISLTPEMLQAYNIPVTSTHPFSAEDWVQKQIAAMNQALADSVYPVTPGGATERVRINAIVVAPKPPPDERTHDGEWFLENDVRDPEVSFYTYEEDIDWGLVHELGHQIGLIDLYASMIDAVSVRVLDGEGFPANFSYEWPRGGLMFGGDTAPHNNSHLFSSHSAGGISSGKGYRSNYYGAYQYDIPERNDLLVLDNEGDPAGGVQVALYQRSGPFNWLGLPEIDNVPEITGTTDADGRLTLANRSAHGGAVTPVGHTLRDNPFGLIDIVGVQNRFLVKLSQGDHVEFHWLDITQFNLAYWMGDTISHTFTISSHIPPPGAPAAPRTVRAQNADAHVALSWAPSPSPGVVGYRVYRATPPEDSYLLAGDLALGTSFEEWMVEGSTCPGHCVYAVTAVDGGGLESGFSNLVYAPSLHAVQDVAVSADGTRVVLDPFNPYSLLRQQPDGRYTHRLAAPWHGMFDTRYLALDDNGRMVISDGGNPWDEHKPVRLFERDGTPSFAFGERGSGPAQFDVPTGVAWWGEAYTYGGPYGLDEHTTLLLHFDGDYGGVEGEVGTAAGTSFAQGHDGQGVLVDEDDTLTYAMAGNLDPAAGTIEFWVRPNHDDDVGQIHVYFEFDESDNGIQIVKHGGGNLHFLMRTPTNLADIFALAGDWRAGEWHHVAATWQGSDMALYVDGLLRASSDAASPPETLASILNIGSSSRGDWQADAVIDELRISDVPRLGNSDTCGRILVADSGNHRIQVFDSLGTYVTAYGGHGSGPGQFDDPQGIAVDTTGRVIVADRGNDRLQVLGFDGTALSFLGVIAAGLSQPTGVATDGLGNIVVADTGHDAIVVLDAAGDVRATYTAPNDGYPGPFSAPHGVAVDAEGTIVVADSGNGRVVTIREAPAYRAYLPLMLRGSGALP
ncbi:MAG: 6-bladed beta-propeller [Anaerolineae bacterium]|nr:6-bladed beta-propeller [Anaerolineae bacterium]